MTQREFEVLRELILHQGRVLARQTLLDSLWDCSFYGGPRTVDQYVKNLRCKLGDVAGLIHTVRGMGYKMENDASTTLR